MTATDPTYAGLLARVLETPEDDVPRLILADWLDENGEPERAEFIRVQCELAGFLPRSAAVLYHEQQDRRGEKCQAGPACDYCALRWREEELLETYCYLWLPENGRDSWWCMNIENAPTPVERIGCEFRRGFVEAVSCDLGTFLGWTCPLCQDDSQFRASGLCKRCIPDIAPRLFASQPVLRVTLFDREPQEYRLAFEKRYVYGWCQVRLGELFYLPPEMFDLLECDDVRGAWKDYPTRATALDALSAALVAYGRANAEGMTHEAVCDNCEGTGELIKPAGPCPDCGGAIRTARRLDRPRVVARYWPGSSARPAAARRDSGRLRHE